jgi:hypothetical protein
MVKVVSDVTAPKAVPVEVTPQRKVVVTPVGETNHGILQELKKTQQNDQAVLSDQMKAIDKNLGAPAGDHLNRQDRFYYNSKMVKGSNTVANRVLETSPEIKTAFGGLSKRGRDAFSEYANARTELSTADKTVATSRPTAELQSIVKNGSADFGERFAALNQHYKNLAGMLHDAGIINDKQFNHYVKNDNYVRIQRDMGDLLPSSFGQGGNSYQLSSSVSRMFRNGSSRGTLDAGQVVADYTQRIYKEVAKNTTGVHLVDNLEQAGLANRLKNSDAAVHKNTITIFRNGKPEYYQVPPALKEAFNNISPQSMNVITRIIAAPGRLFRAGVTGLNPVFIARNLFKDQVTSAINSENVLATHNPRAFADGLFNATREVLGTGHSNLYEEFMKHYGDQTSYDINRNAEDASQLMNRISGGKKVSVVQHVGHPIRSLESIAGITEKSTRFQQFVGEYRKGIKEGLDHQQASERAAISAWRNTVDFGTAGSWGRMINTVMPYWNPGVQGTTQMIRSFRDRPVSSTFKGIAMVGVPLAAATAWNLSTDENKKVYDNIPEYEKDNNLILIPPGTKQNKDGSYDVLKIPLAPGFKDLFMPFRRAMESYAGDKPANAKIVAQDIVQALSGPVNVGSKDQLVSSLIPQAAKPFVQQGMNKDLFTGKDIVPGYINDATDANGNPIPENKKAYKNTGTVVQFIADKLGVSPIRAEKFIKDSAGTVGLNVENFADQVATKLGYTHPTTNADTGDVTDHIGGQSVSAGFKRSFGSVQGIDNANKSDGAKYFDALKVAQKGLNSNEMAAFQSLHPNTKNFLGEKIYESDKVYNSAARLDIYNRFPKVFEADRKINQWEVTQGEPANPMFDLSEEQRKKVLEKANLPPGAKDPELSNLYQKQWYADYQAANTDYYNKLSELASSKGQTLGGSDNPYPTASKELQNTMDYYNTLPKGTGARKSWIAANPGLYQQMQDQYAKIDDWQNKQRGKRGLDATEGAAGVANGYSSGSGSSYSRYYSNRGGGSNFNASSYIKKYTVPKSVAKGSSGSISGKKVAIKASKGTGTVKVTSKKIRLA